MENSGKLTFRKATSEDEAEVWQILQQAIIRRKNEGSKQWQDGYPNPETIKNDIDDELGYVLTESEKMIGYAAVIINNEPAYDEIEGKWLTNGDFMVVHRVAIADEAAGKGYATKIFGFIEEWAIQNRIFSIKVDTNFDNRAMLKILDKLGYKYCGEVYFRGAARKAFEKVLK